MLEILGVFAGLAALLLMCNNEYFLSKCFKKLHLPCTIRVHKVHGIFEDSSDSKVYTYDKEEARNSFRFNVDLNIDGMIIKYYGRY
jgi:hypothetical protein